MVTSVTFASTSIAPSLNCMRKLLQPYISAVLVALSLTVIVSSPFSRAQEQPEEQRKVLRRVVPQYPDLAAKMKMIGSVRVVVVVAPNGQPKSTEVLGGNALLAKSAVDALEQWRWVSAPHDTKEIIQLNFVPRQ